MADSRFFVNSGPFSLKKIVDITGVTLDSSVDEAILIHDIAPLDSADEGKLTFLSNTKYIAELETTKATACIIHPDLAEKAPKHLLLLQSKDPYGAYALIANAFYPLEKVKSTVADTASIAADAVIGSGCRIDSGAVVSARAEIGEGCHIAANAVIGEGVRIGKHTRIGATAAINHAFIGANCIVHSGACIGQDGFGFAPIAGKHVKIPQLGRVVVGDDVEIGANTCIDRGAGPDTVIGDGTKIDNLVQIGHNVQMGRGCIIVSQVGISGSAILGDYVVVGGQTGIAGHLNIGSAVQLAARSGVINNIPPKGIYGGAPAVPVREWHRQNVAIKRLGKKPLSKDKTSVQ